MCKFAPCFLRLPCSLLHGIAFIISYQIRRGSCGLQGMTVFLSRLLCLSMCSINERLSIPWALESLICLCIYVRDHTIILILVVAPYRVGIRNGRRRTGNKLQGASLCLSLLFFVVQHLLPSDWVNSEETSDHTSFCHPSNRLSKTCCLHRH